MAALVVEFVIKVDEVTSIPGKGGGHKFYRWMSDQFDDSLIVEAGTLAGASAKSFAKNPTNTVVTHDIDMARQQGRGFPSNVICKHQDIFTVPPIYFDEAQLIYLDISHNGVDEAKFLDMIEPHFKGILIMDDVNCERRWPALHALFRDLDREHHLLPKSIGATYGTGVVPYGDWTIVIEEES